MLQNLTNVIEKGTLRKEPGRKTGAPQFVIEHDGYRAIVDPRLRGHDIQFVLTTYEKYRK